MTTEHTVQQFRTYLDGKYAHLVSTISNVYSDPPTISASPIYKPEIESSSRKPKEYHFPREHIKPAKAYKKDGLVTRTIGPKTYKLPKISKALKLDDLIEAESRRNHDHDEDRLNLIHARSIKSLDISPTTTSKHKEALPTFTVNEDGVLNIPTPSIEVVEAENEIEPTVPHRFERPGKPSKTMLDSVTYVGFVDFTTTIDDTVVIFRPKKTFSTATRNILIPKIQPTRVHEDSRRFQPSSADVERRPQPDLDSSQPERHRTSKPDQATPSINVSVPKITSGINPLKSLLAASASRRNRLSKSAFNPSSASSSALNNRPRITLNPKLKPDTTPSLESTRRRPVAAPEPNELTSSIDTDSDVELVYKTLFTTYTYFTTFFRASTTRVKSRAEVISNIITLTNILSPSDLASLKSSCEVDRTCQFASSSLPASAAFTDGFIGRPNTKAVVEEPRSSGQEDSDEEESGLNAILKTFYTTYTYFTTLSFDGTSSISTRTEVYSDVKSSGVPVSVLDSKLFSIRPTSTRKLAIEPTSSVAGNLKYSSISRDTTTTEEAEEASTTESNEPTTTGTFVIFGSTENPADTTIAPTPSSGDEESTEETPDVTEDPLENTEVDPSSVSTALKTFYTTYTYFTTLFRNGTSYVTSNLETVTNTADPTASPSVVQPSVTFFTTFTYWTTSIDGDKTIITSQEETKTDILPASLTDQISLLPTSLSSIQVTAAENNEIVPTSTQAFSSESKVSATAAPELESGEGDSSSTVSQDLSSASITPSLASSSLSLEDLDDDFTLASGIATESAAVSKSARASRSRLTFTRPSRTFTPVIRPSLFRPRPNLRPRGKSRSTTVAIITRSDVTPTLIATPASSPLPQSSPSFGASSSVSNKARSSIRESVNPSRASVSIQPTTASSQSADFQTAPTIRSGLSLRRPNPFRARLRERQRQRLQQLRSGSSSEESTTEAPREPITPPRFPVGVPGRTPIFVSSRTETINRKPKDVDTQSSQIVADADNNISVPSSIQTLRERARSRIQSLFRRRRPNFTRPRPNVEEEGDPLIVQESRRRKRQVSSYDSYGTRTRARQSYVRGARQSQPQYFQSLSDPPFTAFRNPYTSTYQDTQSPATSSTASAQTKYSDPDYETSSYYSSSQDSRSVGSSSRTRASASSPKTRSSPVSTRKVRQNTDSSSRSRSRFNPRSRSRLRSRPAQTTTTTTTSRPLRSRFRPRTVSSSSNANRPPSRFPSSNRFSSGSSFDYDYDYDDYLDYDVELQSSQNSVPQSITVTHTVPIRTVIPFRENGRDTFREVLTTSPSLEVIAATDLKSTNIDGSPVIYANTKTNEPAPGTKFITYEALRATETTGIAFTPTRIRGLRTTFSHVVPSTIYNIKPVTTSVVTPVDNNQLLTQLLLQLLGQQQPDPLKAIQQQPTNPSGQLNQLLPNLGINPSPPQTKFVTHTSTYVTTITNVKSTVLPITLRGREIKTTLVESNTEIVTATELSTETIAPTPTVPALPGLLPTAANPLGNIQQQLLAAQLQQQLQKQQQQQILNQQLLSQLNLDPNLGLGSDTPVQPSAVVAEDEGPITSVVTIFVSGKNPGEFSKVTSTVVVGEAEGRYKREAAAIQPSRVQTVMMTANPVQAGQASSDFELATQDNIESSLSDNE